MNNASRSAGGLVDRIKENPVSAAMIGAGAWWLLTKLPDHGRSSSYARNYGNVSSGVGESSYRGDTGWSGGTGESGGAGQSSYRGETGWSGRTGESGGIGDMARSATETVGDYTSRGREQVSQLADQSERAFNRWIRENPLAVGAAAVAVGAVIGAAIPETQRERELVGDARDRLVGAAKDMATQKVEQVTSMMPGGHSGSGGSSSTGPGSSSGSGAAAPAQAAATRCEGIRKPPRQTPDVARRHHDQKKPRRPPRPQRTMCSRRSPRRPRFVPSLYVPGMVLMSVIVR